MYICIISKNLLEEPLKLSGHCCSAAVTMWEPVGYLQVFSEKPRLSKISHLHIFWHCMGKSVGPIHIDRE